MADQNTTLKIGQRLWIIIPWGFEPYEYDLLSTKITDLKVNDSGDCTIYTESPDEEDRVWMSQYLDAMGIGNIRICVSLEDAISTIKEYERGY
ncbi:hypothetical protein [Xylocopilactobacillus apicola]|uniref:Uncharacterized protein n=1 Tax=Xylocopilactobacillus apicola TaxID=2932184 RepID=A0AAU9DU02_9LACO|nr:hypothetical protein [Xylocopilactobacillus apicola]BDR58928.1 hypothetical protein XA3_13690 [Xylocopilactobacillus apicola]